MNHNARYGQHLEFPIKKFKKKTVFLINPFTILIKFIDKRNTTQKKMIWHYGWHENWHSDSCDTECVAYI